MRHAARGQIVRIGGSTMLSSKIVKKARLDVMRAPQDCARRAVTRLRGARPDPAVSRFPEGARP
jgi:hypothetical protein